MHFVGEDYRRACCLLKTTRSLQHIVQKDVSTLAYGTDAWFIGVPQDSPLMWSNGQSTGNLGCYQGFCPAEMYTWAFILEFASITLLFLPPGSSDCSLWIFMMWSEAAVPKACWAIFCEDERTGRNLLSQEHLYAGGSHAALVRNG